MEHRSSDYVSGDDFVVEFLDYRYGFSRFDFEQRVTAAAARLELVPQRELEPAEVADLVTLAATGSIEQPLSAWAHTSPRTSPRSTGCTPSRSATGCASWFSGEPGWTIASRPACST